MCRSGAQRCRRRRQPGGRGGDQRRHAFDPARIGTAHWCATVELAFAAAAHRWLNDTLDRLDRLERAGADPGAELDLGLLRGLTGAALALEAAISSRPPAWDAFLLLSA